MKLYVHQTPGRLRLRNPLFKRNAPEAERASRLVDSREGVLNCRVNTVTGSMLILYHQNVVESESLLRLLEEHGCFRGPLEAGAVHGSVGKTLSNVGMLVVKAMAAAVLEQIAQRSVLALMGAMR